MGSHKRGPPHATRKPPHHRELKFEQKIWRQFGFGSKERNYSEGRVAMKLCRTWREGDEGNLSKKLTPASPHVVKLGSSGTRPMNGTCAGGSSLAQSSSWTSGRTRY